MTPASWHRVKSLFGQLATLTPSRRALALERAPVDGSARAELDQLLACAAEMGSFLDAPRWPTARDVFDPWAPGDCISGRYRIVRQIGRGGMGEVYEADDLELNTRVALKTIRADLVDEDAAGRFRREVELARRVSHPNVCRIFDLGRDERPGSDDGLGARATAPRGALYLSMELLAGETLEERLARDGPLDEADASAIAAQLCAGLEAAHAAGVVHRDLKTSNVMLVPTDQGLRVVVTDFGLATGCYGNGGLKLGPLSSPDTSAAAARVHATSATHAPSPASSPAGEICGTPHFMAPEQVSGEPVDRAADIFALGVVLYRVLTARYPFDGPNAWYVMVRRLTEDPLPLRRVRPGISLHWERAIAQCLARDPSRRPARARDVVTLIDPRTVRAHRRRHAFAMVALVTLSLWPVGRSHVLTAPLPDAKRVAVLPFTLEGTPAPSRSGAALADGVSESVSTQLDDLRSLDPKLSSVPFADLRAANADTFAQARRLFGVNLAIAGAVRAVGTRLHVRVRLIETASGRALRQEEAVLAGDATALEPALRALFDISPTSASAGRLAAHAAIAPSAYEFYEQGKGYLLRSGERDADAAIDVLTRAVDAAPTFALAQAALARAYAKRFQRAHDQASADRAEQAAAAALRLDPSLASAQTARGMVLRQMQRRDEAVQAFLAALRLDPDDGETLNQLANTYDELGDPLRAEATFQRAARANPGYWVGYNNLGRFYLRHRQFEQAKEQFRWATALAPDNPRAHSNLGGLHLTLGEYTEARATLQRAYDLQPTAALCSNLGTALLALGEIAPAIRMFEQAATLAPRDHRYHRNLGDAYDAAGRTADARAAWTRAATMIEADAARTATMIDADAARVSGAGNSASAPPAGSASGAASADQCATAALYRAKLHDLASARRWLASAERVVRPDDAGTRLKMAQARELIGDRSGALEALARAVSAGLARSEIEQSAELARLRRDPRYAARVAATSAP